MGLLACVSVIQSRVGNGARGQCPLYFELFQAQPPPKNPTNVRLRSTVNNLGSTAYPNGRTYTLMYTCFVLFLIALCPLQVRSVSGGRTRVQSDLFDAHQQHAAVHARAQTHDVADVATALSLPSVVDNVRDYTGDQRNAGVKMKIRRSRNRRCILHIIIKLFYIIRCINNTISLRRGKKVPGV